MEEFYEPISKTKLRDLSEQEKVMLKNLQERKDNGEDVDVAAKSLKFI